ncbi:MAG: LysR family transcriptional regulator [Collimonas fungivorans]|uniref:LysR family transcriptional regulator n=1 Tax=Collimonas fungivorans TaxID=158899 RepID=UPI000FEDB277|nr:LysR family transcriptional regulator [Collimonas fungivorans]MDB5768488.1 LysR family transcriptional regulator [Collimonas fungivorans]
MAILKLDNKVTLRHLQAFVELAGKNSFSKAAQELSVTQPALSAAIKQLENQLGTKLFDRTTHQIELTRQGAVVLEYAKHLLNTANNTFGDIQRAIGSGRHRIRIGTIPSAMTLTAAVVARYSKTYGDQIEIVLCDMPNDALLDALHTGELDFCVGVKQAQTDALETVTLFEDELVLIVARGHPLAASKEVQWRQMAGEEIVMFTTGSIWEFASAALRQHELAPSSLYQVVHSESLYGIVRSGIAVGIMPSLYTAYLKDSSLHIAPLRSPTLKRKIILMRRNEVSRSKWTDHCFKELRNDLKQANHWF